MRKVNNTWQENSDETDLLSIAEVNIYVRKHFKETKMIF